MTVYIAVFGALILLRYFLGGGTRLSRQAYWTTLLSLFVFSAFRFEVGCDWWGYLYQYEVLVKDSAFEPMAERDPLWWLIMDGLVTLDVPYPWLNVVSSAIFFFGAHVLIRRQPDPLGMLIMLFPILIINMPMSGMRQGAAIGVMCVSLAMLIDRKVVRFVLFTLISSALHSSALVFLMLTPLVSGQYTWRRLALAGLLAVPGVLVVLSTDAAQVAVTRYVDTDIDAAGAIFRAGILAITGVTFFLFLRKKWWRVYANDYRLVSIGSLVMLLVVAVLPISSVISDRIGYYMIPIQTAIFARLPYLPIKNHKAIWSAIPYLGLVFVFVVWTALSWHFDQCYVPYDSWIFGFPDSPHFSY